MNKNRFLKRYFVLIASAVVFLLIAATLFGETVFISSRMDRALYGRNTAGAARAHSQIVLLSLLEMQHDLNAGLPISDALHRTVRDSAKRVDGAITLFRVGGRIEGDDARLIYEVSDGTPAVRAAVERVIPLWSNYYTAIKPLVDAPSVDAVALQSAVARGRADNQQLFSLLNEMTSESADALVSATQRLRLSQFVGGALILLNFIFASLFAFRRLAAGDHAIELSRKQNDDILATVKEGLFLVTSDLVIGSQMSRSLPQVLQRKVAPGMGLTELLGSMVTAQTLESTRDYLGLLFGKRVKENLVSSLNPLSEVAVSSGEAKAQTRFLNFQFNRVLEEERVLYLLVTVTDATEHVRLAAEVAAAKSRTREEMEALLRVLSRESTDVRFFLQRVGLVLQRVNENLRQSAAARRGGADYNELVNSVFRDVHSIKSEAAALGLDMIEGLAHTFELDLIELRERGEVEGSDMVKLTVHLDDLFECVATIRDFLDRISGSGNTQTRSPHSLRAADTWRMLAKRIADDHGKQVQVHAQLATFDKLPNETINALRAIGLQLLRNAVAHGIETESERVAAGKPAIGTVSFRSEEAGSRQIEFTVRDDGRGIALDRVRDALTGSGRYTAEQVAALNEREVMMKIFEPGVSTAQTNDRDAGHGVGMDLVMKQVRAMAGTIGLSTKPGAYTEFRIRLPIAAQVTNTSEELHLSV